MQLDTQTTIFMICFVYLMLHGGIWLALQEYRSYQVKLWSVKWRCCGLVGHAGKYSRICFHVPRSTLDAVRHLGADGCIAHVSSRTA